MADIECLDAIIIGTGQGGKPLAGALADAGWRCAIIERDRVGGACVIRGCTPTKTMIASARVAYLVKRAAGYGVHTGDVSVDLTTVRKRKRDIVDEWSAGSKAGLERHETLELIMGAARFVGPHEVEVALEQGGTRRLEADHIFINVGASQLSMTRVARALEMDETRGFMKAIVDTETDQILGATILGIEGGEVVSVLQMAMMGKLPWTTLRDAVIAHPTLSESLNNLFMTLD